MTSNSLRIHEVLPSLAATMRLAEDLGRILRGGDLLLLSGPVGAGKTTFLRALAASYGVREAVRSPTFVLVHMYRARRGPVRWLVHIDGYRLRRPSAWNELGLEEQLRYQDTVVAIEWPPKKLDVLGRPTFKITLAPTSLRRREAILVLPEHRARKFLELRRQASLKRPARSRLAEPHHQLPSSRRSAKRPAGTR